MSSETYWLAPSLLPPCSSPSDDICADSAETAI